MCFSIIKKHEGTIEVESKPGEGSAFYIYLPAATGKSIIFTPKSSEPFKGSGLFIVMDDQEVMRDVCRAMLQSMGYEVICTEDGQKAITIITNEINSGSKIAGAIFDLTVPGGMGGRATVEHLRKAGISFPIFAASGHADDPVFTQPVDFGFTGRIAKPFRKTELADLLKKYLT